MSTEAASAPAGLEIRQEAGSKTLALSGRLDTPSAALLWPRVMAEAAGGPALLDVSGLQALDTTGATLLLVAEAAGKGNAIKGAAAPVAAVLDRVRAARAN